MTKRLLLLVIPAVLAACTSGSPTTAAGEDDLRGLSKAEALADFNQVVENIRTFYGPLEYKKEKFGFDLDQAAARGRAEIEAGRSESDRVRAIYKLLAQLRDGHVSLSWKLRGDESVGNNLLFIVTPLEGKWIVAGAAPTAGGIKRGDELVSIDGMTPAKMEELLLQIQQVGTPESTKHDVGASMTFRPFYAPKELAPRGPMASVVVRRADGTEATLSVPWEKDPGGLAGQIQPPAQQQPAPPPPAPPSPQAKAKRIASAGQQFAAFSQRANWIVKHELAPEATVLQVASQTPFYFSPATKQQFGFVEVSPKAAALEKYGVTMPAAQDPAAANFIGLKAFKYKHLGKTVLIVRIPEFSVPQDNYDENVGWLSALLDENSAPAQAGASLENTPADAVVLDVTHNPGGAVNYVQGLATLFLKRATGGSLQANNVDRKWVMRYIDTVNAINAIPGLPPLLAESMLGRAQKMEAALDAEKALAPFMPISGSSLGPKAEDPLEAVFGAETLAPHPLLQWKKPVLVLHDELSGSGGDLFPLLLQSAGMKTFGARTMGLGGTVEPVGILANSGAELRLTRGLNATFVPSGQPRLIENVGVTPDFAYAHTVADFRAGYLAYVKAFSDVVLRQIPSTPTPIADGQW
jgi:hypothetical protein